MAEKAGGNVTQLLDAVRAGDEHAADRLLPLVYDELRKLAHQRMAHDPLSTRTLNESFTRNLETLRPWPLGCGCDQ